MQQEKTSPIRLFVYTSFAISVCALFNFYNRWIDATGVRAMSEDAHRQFGERTAHHGYTRK
jgi:hypothetical protein